MAATLVIAVKRFSARLDSNPPFTYYGLLIACWRGKLLGTGRILCGLLLGFEFLGAAVEKLIRALELLVFAYVTVRCAKFDSAVVTYRSVGSPASCHARQPPLSEITLI
jgi:hypothetical protein